ncbi:MAG: EAL domain-containing protein [Novosphingobium sp.]
MAGVRGLLGAKPEDGANAPQPASASTTEQQLALELLHDYEKSGLGWFWSTNAEGQVEYISECIARQLEKSPQELSGQPFQTLFVVEPDEEGTVERTLPLLLNAHKTFTGLVVSAASGEEEACWAIAGRPQFSPSGDFTGYRGNGSDVTASRKDQRDASRLARYDSLTGLLNRHSLSKRLETILTGYASAKRSCALMMIDLDRFKQVNDSLGHPAGDELLKQVAERLRQVIPTNCEIGRLGGDEFQAILPDLDDRGNLGEIAKKVISIISQPYSIAGSRCIIGASVGIAISPYDGFDSEELVRGADLALYAAKGGGRGQFRFYSADLQDEAERRQHIEEDLRHALGNDQMSLAYQPLVDNAKNEVVALEAILRWEHPEYGEIPASIFLPTAERCNLMNGLGDWALKRACEDAVQWPGNVRVAVDVSPAQFANPNFPALVTQALAASELAPERLELELPESVLSSEDQSADEVLVALKILGVRLVVDHFGTGRSSLGYLSRAPVDKVKIDRTFVRGISEEGNRNGAVIKAIVSLAEELGLETVAEGIEARDELERMRRLRLNQIQGDIYAPAVSFDEAMSGLAGGEWIIEPEGPSRYRDERRTMFRKVGLIHEDYRYEVMMRNLSRTGCLIEGLLDVPLDTQFVVDFGEGQLAVATVSRSAGSMQGLEFELPLVDDGAGGLVTRNRLSPYVLAAAGMPGHAGPISGHLPGQTNPAGAAALAVPRFAQPDQNQRKSA